MAGMFGSVGKYKVLTPSGTMGYTSDRYGMQTYDRLMQQMMGAGGQGGAPSAGGGNSMNLFMSLLPAILGGGGLQSGAGNWLQNIFGGGAPAAPQPPAPVPPPFAPRPFEGNLPGPLKGGAFTGLMPRPGIPGARPDPFTALRGLSGPFGNGGGPMAPMMGGAARRASKGVNRTVAY